jgi:hypothetical protein
MKRIFNILIVIGLVCVASITLAEEQVKPGAPAPSIAEPQKPDQPAAAPALKPDPSGANTGGAAGGFPSWVRISAWAMVTSTSRVHP